MTPPQSLRGDTALVDAALLSRSLADAAASLVDLVAAIGSYETLMRGYGFRAVEQSLCVANAVVSTSIFGRLGFRGVLRFTSALHPLENPLFRRRTLPAA